MSTLLSCESYKREGSELVRKVQLRDGDVAESHIKVAARHKKASTPDATFDQAWLSSLTPPGPTESRGIVRVVDVFAGCGGLTLGVAEAARALGLKLEPRLAIDLDGDALDVYGRNFPEAEICARSVEDLIDTPGAKHFTEIEQQLAYQHPQVDLLIGGPPCQGHSNLNNHTRWADERNELYLAMARFCEIFQPKHVIIENVPGVQRDSSQVAQRTWKLLERLGYQVSTGVLDASQLGSAQIRKRSVTLASRCITPNVAQAQLEASVEPRPLNWAIGDLRVDEENVPFDTPSRSNAENQARIKYMFDNGLHDLPNELRPDCHRLKKHSYTPMYGRLHGDRPSPTITTGFGSMGRGRFVHPFRPVLRPL